jgi:RluA family pseudouridine synthase
MKIPPFREMIIYEDEDVIVINKPPFISSLDERSGTGLSIIKHARTYEPLASLCHRLDKETSGALIISRNENAYKFVSAQFMNRQVEKIYHAVAEGVQELEHEVYLPISAVAGKGKIDKRGGKAALTYVKTIKKFKHYTLLECRPVTGRFHQIRVHLKALNSPIAGDVLYGASFPYVSKIKRGYRGKDEEEERPMINRVALHARQIKFTSPSGAEVEADAEYPNDYRTLMKMLEKYDS